MTRNMKLGEDSLWNPREQPRQYFIPIKDYCYGLLQTLRKVSFIVESGSAPSNRNSQSPPSLVLGPREVVSVSRKKLIKFEICVPSAPSPKMDTLFFDQTLKFDQFFF